MANTSNDKDANTKPRKHVKMNEKTSKPTQQHEKLRHHININVKKSETDWIVSSIEKNLLCIL